MFNSSWHSVLSTETSKEYFQDLMSFLDVEYESEIIFPQREDLFNAFNAFEFQDTKVVILGQDPYHDVGQAHGLAFSVVGGVKLPPSLKNIFKELEDDVGCELSSDGNLSYWASQGVLLINTVLSVRAHEAHSHQNKGWERFSDVVINTVSEQCNNVVFILWGKPAQSKVKLIDEEKHLVLKAPHPSPLSSYRGFFGSKPFSKTNDYLQLVGKQPIQWCL